MLELFKTLCVFIVIYLIITVIWQVYELHVFGKLKPEVFHSIIAMLLSFSLTLNLINR